MMWAKGKGNGQGSKWHAFEHGTSACGGGLQPDVRPNYLRPARTTPPRAACRRCLHYFPGLHAATPTAVGA